MLYISIVGIDRVPLGYYRGKLRAERLIESSGVPYTILRATQFHDLLRVLFAWSSKPPVMPVPAVRFQPVDAAEVAARLAELAGGEPVGRARDMGGPQVREAADLAKAYPAADGRRRRLATVRLPGRTFDAYRRGQHLAPDQPSGTTTFERYLAEHPRPADLSYRAPRPSDPG